MFAHSQRRLVFTLVVPVALLLAACASSGPTVSSSGSAPQVEIAQEVTGVETLAFRGPIPLSYVIHIKNPLSVPVTLKRLELRTQGSGAYRLNAEAFGLSRTIPAGGEETFRVSTWGRSRGGFISEPVTIVGTAIFETPQGSVARFFTEYLPQPA